MTGDACEKFTQGMISFAQQWMQFVKVGCERGRGVGSKGSDHGLDFIMKLCEHQNINQLDSQHFEVSVIICKLCIFNASYLSFILYLYTISCMIFGTIMS